MSRYGSDRGYGGGGGGGGRDREALAAEAVDMVVEVADTVVVVDMAAEEAA